MKLFIAVSYDFIYSTAINRLIAEHGAGAVAFYFMAMGLMGLNGGWHWRSHLLALRCRGLRFQTIDEILHTSELFEITDDDVVLLADVEHNGVENFKQTVFYSCRKTHPWTATRMRSRARTDARVRKPADGGAPVPMDGGALVPIDGGAPGSTDGGEINLELEKELEKELETEKKKARWLALFFQSHCPHLLEMEEPMTVEQFDDLVKRFGLEEVKSVLTDMENELDLNKRSCAHTAENWLKGRARRNKTKNDSL